MKPSKIVALAPFAAFLGLGIYIFGLRSLGDPRALDLRLSGAEMRPAETAAVVIVLVAFFCVWLGALWRASGSRQFGWFVAILLIWPATALYIWREE
jgi:hypothetical protein